MKKTGKKKKQNARQPFNPFKMKLEALRSLGTSLGKVTEYSKGQAKCVRDEECKPCRKRVSEEVLLTPGSRAAASLEQASHKDLRCRIADSTWGRWSGGDTVSQAAGLFWWGELMCVLFQKETNLNYGPAFMFLLDFSK